MQALHLVSCDVLCVVLLCMQQKLLIVFALLPYADLCRAVISHGNVLYAELCHTDSSAIQVTLQCHSGAPLAQQGKFLVTDAKQQCDAVCERFTQHTCLTQSVWHSSA